MKDFIANPVDSMGGIAWFNFFECSQVNNLNLHFNNTITNGPSLSGSLFKGIVNPDSRLLIVANRDEHGCYFTSTVEGTVAVSKEISLLFNEMTGRDFMLIISDADSLQYLLGKPDEPLSFVWEMDSGTASGIKQIRYSFTGKQRKHPPVYTVAGSMSALSELIQVKEMALSESYTITNTITMDADGIILNAHILWADNVIGTITQVTKDAFGITSMKLDRPEGKYVVISISRDENGNILLKTVSAVGF